jgi:hypothetical protein
MNFFWGTTKLFRNIMFLHQVAKRKTNGDTIFQKFYVPMSRFGREVEVRANDGTGSYTVNNILPSRRYRGAKNFQSPRYD